MDDDWGAPPFMEPLHSGTLTWLQSCSLTLSSRRICFTSESWSTQSHYHASGRTSWFERTAGYQTRQYNIPNHKFIYQFIYQFIYHLPYIHNKSIIISINSSINGEVQFPKAEIELGFANVAGEPRQQLRIFLPKLGNLNGFVKLKTSQGKNWIATLGAWGDCTAINKNGARDPCKSTQKISGCLFILVKPAWAPNNWRCRFQRWTWSSVLSTKLLMLSSSSESSSSSKQPGKLC